MNKRNEDKKKVERRLEKINKFRKIKIENHTRKEDKCNM